MNMHDAYQPVSMGTTLIGIKYSEGVVLAADTLTSRGIFSADRGALKINELSPSVANFGSIKVMRCGNAAHSQRVTKMVKNYLTMHTMELNDQSKISMDTVLNLYRTICYGNKNFLSCAFIISDGKDLASVSSSGVTVKHDLITFAGSGSTYVNGFVKANTRPNMSFAEAREVAIKAVSLAIDSDGGSGGNARICNISNTGRSEMEVIDNKELRDMVPA